MNFYLRLRANQKRIRNCKLKRSTIIYIIYVAFFFCLCHIISQYSQKDSNGYDEGTINLVTVLCDSKPHFVVFSAMIKSALVNQKSSKLHFITFTDNSLHDAVWELFANYSKQTNGSFTYELQKATHNEVDGGKYWKCASERLFFPDSLPAVDKILFVDVDVLFLSDLSDIWSHFKLMNSTQMCGLARDSDNTDTSLYRRLNTVPYYADGLNDGVILMDLKKMRAIGWSKIVHNIIDEYGSKFKFPDQDIYNIHFHFHPERVRLLPCRFNMQGCHFLSIDGMCRDAVIHGMAIVHGTGQVFLTPRKDPYTYLPMYFIYESYLNYKLGDDPKTHLAKPVRSKLAKRGKSIFTELMILFFENTEIMSV